MINVYLEFFEKRRITHNKKNIFFAIQNNSKNDVLKIKGNIKLYYKLITNLHSLYSYTNLSSLTYKDNP